MHQKHLLTIVLSLLFQGVMLSQAFQDNFSEEQLGEIPSKWEVLRGEAAVAQVDGKKVVDMTNNSIVMPIVNGQTNNYLQDQFTFEFDAYFDTVTSLFWQRYELRLWDNDYSYNMGNISMQMIQIHSHGAKTTLQTPEYLTPKTYVESLETLEAVWRHIKVEYNQGTFRLHIDDELILDLALPFQPKMFSIGTMKYEPSIPLKGGITNVLISGEEQTTNDDSSCAALPTELQLDILTDSTSLFNRRLRYLEAFDIQQLRGIPEIQYFDGQFSLPTRIRSSNNASESYSAIPIVAHILRKSNRKEGLALENLYWSINNTNELLDRYGFYCYVEKINYIDDDDLFETVYNHEDSDDDGINNEVEILRIPDRNIKNKLNIYFVPETASETGMEISWSSFPDISNTKQHIIMRNSHAKLHGILTHELGHWFNLLHTHETARGKDRPGGIDCLWDGDLCCDTPPDNNLSGKVDENCNYTGNESNLGIRYDPDPLNIMSYTNTECRLEFSEKQLKRMYNAYLGMEKDRDYTFKFDKEIGKIIATDNWTPGWNQIEYFKINNQNYMSFLKTSNGEVAIHKINNDGTQGAKTGRAVFGNYWSAAKVITTASGVYLFTLKNSNGNYQIRKINSNGRISNGTSGMIVPGDWDIHYVSNGGSYLILLNKSSNRIRTYEFNSDGTLGNLLYDKHLAIENYVSKRVGSKILRYNSTNGDLRVLDILRDGSFKNFNAVQNIDTGFSSIANILDHDDSNTIIDDRFSILAHNANNGHIQKYYLDADYNISKSIYDSSKLKTNLSPGFDIVTPYNFSIGNQRKNFVMFSNSSSGEVKIYELNN